ncbi:zinc finger BED domain-containing protein RICESLEEPER 2-like [Tasmannia lanceolata]|uniref:zinc finger BED domain-containing protein RICESLEEPER 2-like n=1 Tax=Tasmannia lanceolata TaxID=3420 RepID=UPI0040638ACF
MECEEKKHAAVRRKNTLLLKHAAVRRKNKGKTPSSTSRLAIVFNLIVQTEIFPLLLRKMSSQSPPIETTQEVVRSPRRARIPRPEKGIYLIKDLQANQWLEMNVPINVDEDDIPISDKCAYDNALNLRSKVWIDFMNEKKEDGSEWAYCKHCNKKYAGSSRVGTSSLSNHLKTCFAYKQSKRQKLDVGQQILKMGEKMIDGSVDISFFEFNQQISRDDFTRMVIYHEYPFSIADHVFFRVFLRNLQPMFKLITRMTVKADCLKMYEIEKKNIYEELESLPCKVSLTSDMWTSRTMEGYLCLTCHFIDNDWKFQKKILNFINVETPHTGEEISKSITARLYDWNIDNKVFSITLDNCTTNDVVIREMLKVFHSKKSLISNGEFLHVRSCAHILNLIVQDGLGYLRESIHNIRESIKFVKSSQARLERFKKIANQVRSHKSSFFYDVPTRWNSTYLMLVNTLKFKEAFNRMAECDMKYTCAPSEYEWNLAEMIVGCLKLFYDVTERIFGCRYPTSNLYFNDICDIYLALKKWNTSEVNCISNMAASMLEKFEKYWGITSIILGIASILDPRYKMKSIQYFFREIYSYEEERKMNIENVKNALFRFYDAYVEKYDIHDIIPHGHVSTSIATSSTSNSNLAKLAFFVMETTEETPQKSELELYLDEKVHPGAGIEDGTFDILSWWKLNGRKYPMVAQIARDVLAIPISTVASESAFSTGGRVLDEYRSSLKPSTVEALICTHDWLKAKGNGIAHLGSIDAYSTITSASIIDSEYAIHAAILTGKDEEMAGEDV